MRIINRVAAMAALGLAALGAAACQSSLTGNEGNLTFYYPTDDELDFNKPIAVGAKLDLTVKTAGVPHANVDLTAVTTGNSQVLASKGFLGNAFTIEAVGDGNTSITVNAKKADGTATHDTINMLARKAEVLDMVHSCSALPLAYYLVDKDIFVPYDLKLKDGRAVIGYGYHPLTIAPATGLVWNQVNKAQWAYVYHTQKLPGDVTLTSQLETGKSWSFRLVDESQIDGGRVDPVTGKTIEVLAGTSAFLLARPTIGGQPLCQPDTTFTATGKSPDICTVTPSAAKLPNSKEFVEAWSWVTVKGSKVGVCEFDVTWPKGNKGQGVTVPMKVNIVQLLKP